MWRTTWSALVDKEMVTGFDGYSFVLFGMIILIRVDDTMWPVTLVRK